MKTLSRRDFIKATSLTAASAGILPALAGCASTRSTPKAAGVRANEEIRFAVVGFNGRGRDHIKSLDELRAQGEKVRVTALCDVDRHVLDRAVKEYADKGEPVAGHQDIRQLLEDANVDAISIATPNHWHALATIWALQAGKDVYVEKPVSHEVWEGRQMVIAARKYGRIVQTGTQSRSSRTGIATAVEWVRAGNLGKILISRGLCYKRRGSIGKVDAPQPIPPFIDYNLWCGPAPEEPLMRKRLHYDWHWVWPTGNGDLGNQGIHEMDVARWFLGEMELSPRIAAGGGRLGYVDDGTTPNTLILFHDYAKAPLLYEVRGLPQRTGTEKMDNFKGASIGIIVQCEGGYVRVPSYNEAIAFDKDGKEIQRWKGSESHFANFIKAVRSRKYTDLHADILEGHLSSALCHTGNISYRLGQKASPQEIREAIKAEPDAEDTFQRMLGHLQANEIDLAATPLTLGPVLKMDPKKERFLGNAAANELLKRHYRPPFVVPAKV